LGANGFYYLHYNKIKSCIRNNKHRFYNNKTKYIVEAREYIDIKNKIKNIIKNKGENEARDWLVKNIKGMGLKESSHFLRNVGYKNIAILDRHILDLMKKYDIIDEKPKILNKNKYFKIEQKFKKIAERLNISPAELDLYMWFMKTGEVLK
jgi:N-glycosylase/DNA lyase